MRRLESFEEFWPYYVSQHLGVTTRALHFLGTLFVLGTIATAILVRPTWLLVAPFAGYGPAWIGHFFFEKNRPATFTYPFWSLLGDFRMFGLTLLGRMGPEVERAAALYPKPLTH